MITETRFCQRCGIEIPAERLEIIPDTLYCVKCVQARGGEFVYRVVPENIGKAGSMKKNYSGCRVVKIRK